MAFNTQISNITNTRTWQQARYSPIRNTMSIPDALLLDGTAIDPNTALVDGSGHTYYWVDRMQFYRPDISFLGTDTANALSGKGYDTAFGTWTVRFGARFSF